MEFIFILSVLLIIILIVIIATKSSRSSRGGSKRNNSEKRIEHIGEVGERKVDRTLNRSSSTSSKSMHLNNIIIVDSFGRSHQIDHIEIRTNGIFCIETKNYKGWIFGSRDQEYWTQSLYNNEKHGLLNPLKQNESHVKQIKSIIGNEYNVHSLVVMAQNNADKINCENVINLRDLKSYLSRFDDGTRLSDQQISIIYFRIKKQASLMSNEEHVQNIKKTQENLKNGICPCCGGKLVKRNGKNGIFYGCSNYPRCKFTKNSLDK